MRSSPGRSTSSPTSSGSPPSPPPDPDSDGAAGRSEVLQRLDDQPPKSVIYVALGSKTPLIAKNTHELALRLERFLWALRKPAGMFSSDDGGVLPDGFEERMRGRGVVCMGWVPQVEMLSTTESRAQRQSPRDLCLGHAARLGPRYHAHATSLHASMARLLECQTRLLCSGAGACVVGVAR